MSTNDKEQAAEDRVRVWAVEQARSFPRLIEIACIKEDGAYSGPESIKNISREHLIRLCEALKTLPRIEMEKQDL